MSDEEKKAIDSITAWVDFEESTGGKLTPFRIVLNLIKKLFKEIEELKEENKELSDKLTEKICKGVEEEILEEYRQTIISKNKEIEELKDKNKFYNTAYNLGKTYTNKKWEDKI